MASFRLIKNAKIIADPLWGLIDITDYVPMVDTPPFQALGFKYQLGVSNHLFPAATHTRKQHSFGAFKRTQDLALRWQNWGMITADQARLLSGYALWHDIGHGPFSHVVEEVTIERFGRNHNENGLLVIERFKNAVSAAGLDFTELKKLFTHENPLGLGVRDKNLGTEKLDYLARDAYYTLGEVPGVEYLARHTYFIDGDIVIDEKAIDQAKAIQEFYVRMYKNVYLCKNSVIAQRLMQKMALELLRHNNISEDEFWALTDFGLLGLLETSTSPAVRQHYKRFMIRDLPKTAITMRFEKFADMSIAETGKSRRIFGIAEDVMERFLANARNHTPSKLDRMEQDIEKLVGLPEHSIVIVPPFTPERFVPADISIYLPGGKKARMSQYYQSHFKALEDEGKAYVATRVCTFDAYRSTLSEEKTAEKIRDYLIASVV